MIRFCGLDVHRRDTRACVVDAAGAILHEQTLPTTRQALVAFAAEHLSPEDHVALEATFHCWAIARTLAPHVGRVLVSNPLQTKAIAQAKIKTDKVDARALAQLLRSDYLPLVWQPDVATQQLRILTHRRATLVSERTRLKNRIHSVLAWSLVPIPAFVKDLFSDKGRAWLHTLALDEQDRALIDSDLRLLAKAEEELDAVEILVARQAYEDPRAKLLMTLPGVDYAVAQTLLAALGDIRRFADGQHAASYLGLVPSTHQSAEHCYHGPITKQGSGKARWMLIQAAQHVAEHPGPLGAFCRRLLRKKNRNVAVVATARKLVVIAWYMLTANEPYRYAQPLPTQNKLARLRVRVTGKKRVGGTKKGQLRSERYGTGQGVRRVAALPEVYQDEGLPAATPPGQLPAGEQRMLTQSQLRAFVESLQRPAERARKAGSPPSAEPPAMAGSTTRSSGRPCNCEKPGARTTVQRDDTPRQAAPVPAVDAVDTDARMTGKT